MTAIHFKIKRAAIAAGTGLVLTAMAACSSGGDPTAAPAPGTDAVAQVGSSVLTRADLRRAMPAGLSAADSVAFADAYVRGWITDNLIAQDAMSRVSDREEIERLTEEYRRNLIMWDYRRRMVQADTSLRVSDADVRAYYDSHADAMRLQRPLLRGIYVKIESDAPALKEVRKLYKSSRQDDIEKLEKVELRGAIHYDYFRDQWIPWEQIITKIPTDIPESSLRKGYALDFESDGFTYLLSVSDVLPAGTRMPFEAAEPQIRETLEALRLTEIDAALRQRIYKEAQDAGRFTIF